ncbi:MAG: 6-carboxytetrahydropterin synthase QueD [Candidatus Omnitrophica bacterium]|nr:6-carboxytetrahydropterin synthase QueD [Candidatus Omnitrophota bacterium]
MYVVEVSAEFNSAHNLIGYKGKCEALHGHNWKVKVSVRSDDLDEVGMVVDFKILKQRLNNVIDKLDHKYLNDLGYFNKTNPTSENIARYIYESMSEDAASPNVASVTVWETDSASATYSRAVIS